MANLLRGKVQVRLTDWRGTGEFYREHYREIREVSAVTYDRRVQRIPYC